MLLRVVLYRQLPPPRWPGLRKHAENLTRASPKEPGGSGAANARAVVQDLVARDLDSGGERTAREGGKADSGAQRAGKKRCKVTASRKKNSRARPKKRPAKRGR